MLFHLADPSAAVAEATRVLRLGGRAGTITWAWERDPPAAMAWDEILAASGVPTAPLRRVDSGLDRPDSVAALLRSAGLEPEQVWTERLGRQWDRASFAALASGSGAARLRLSRLDPATRADALARLHDGLARRPAADFAWEGEVICAVAVRQGRLSGQASARGGPQACLADPWRRRPAPRTPVGGVVAADDSSLSASSSPPGHCYVLSACPPRPLPVHACAARPGVRDALERAGPAPLPWTPSHQTRAGPESPGALSTLGHRQ